MEFDDKFAHFFHLWKPRVALGLSGVLMSLLGSELDEACGVCATQNVKRNSLSEASRSQVSSPRRLTMRAFQNEWPPEVHRVGITDS